jgi:hypothetical protein
MEADLLPLLFDAFDYMWNRTLTRLDGLTVDEYLWEPVPDAWTVRPEAGRWRADFATPDPVPAPVTTIAWRMWHIADCLASYVAPHLGPSPLPGESREWVGEPRAARGAMQLTYDTFRDRIHELGEAGLRQELGPAWGPFAHDSWAALVIHAMDEIVHHGAEIGLLRDLYLRRGAALT